VQWVSASVSPTTTATDRGLARLRRWLETPIDGASLAAFRVLFGSLLLIAIVRYAAKGMIRQAFVEPRMFFPLLPGLEPLPWPGMHVLFGILALAAIALIVGWHTRLAAGLFCLLFSYAHFADLTHYLNHYWLITLITGLLAFLPSGRLWSLDARRRPAGHAFVPRWTLALLRFQVACVYLFAGIAKLRSDWLVHALPLRIWLPGSADAPLVGPLLVHPDAALVISWAGALFDLTIPLWLSWRRSRPLALVAVLAFHLATVPLFRLGMFPFLMLAASLLFLEPDWPRRWLKPAPAGPPPRFVLRTPVALLLAGYAAVQVLLPLRQHLYRGSVLWTERGYRFAWNVMLMEKNGVAEFIVRDRLTGARLPVRLRDHLTPLQIKMMSTQPDLIRDFARRLAEQTRQQGRAMAVEADVLVSLNGRPPQRLIDLSVDLGGDLEGVDWILDASEEQGAQP